MLNRQKLINFLAERINHLEAIESMGDSKSDESLGCYKDLLNILSNEIDTSQTIERDLFSLADELLADLPSEVRDELSLSEADKFDAQATTLLRLARRPLSLNELIVGFYRKFGIQYKRPSITARLYRMLNNKAIVSPSKGLYSLSEFLDSSQPKEESNED